jgi:uncharacterized protein YcbK (DUF882 family)
VQISKYFTWHEAIYLPQWQREADINELSLDVTNNLTVLFTKMDSVREAFNSPINVHVAFRPKVYNALVKGAVNSAHLYGMACDFDVKGLDCDSARKKILDLGLLDTLNLRMERNDGGNWVHLDIRNVPHGGNRYFNP